MESGPTFNERPETAGQIRSCSFRLPRTAIFSSRISLIARSNDQLSHDRRAWLVHHYVIDPAADWLTIRLFIFID